MSLLPFCLIIVLLPLIGSVVGGLFRSSLGCTAVHRLTITGVLVSFGLSVWVAYQIITGQHASLNVPLYTWASGLDVFPYVFQLGFLIDPLSVVMMVVVTFVSLLVHIYSIGYMAGDPGYSRFFSYLSLFTFMMLMLVTANNFLQLFFGWEGVGLVSYLLIGFWYDKESALQGSLKAFLVNRVGDFGFILGLGLIFTYTGSLDYAIVFHAAHDIAMQSISIWGGHPWSLITVICLLLFIGAMGKSAQVPLHVWLPESMEGPTPISALIHAATMVTAGVFMVARISPLLELSNTALSVILVIGATGALFLGILALVMHDIKRVIAYSTLSQLGYMMVAMGASAYSAGIFHLLTHACFKALLFLAAGSVILGMHHEQDMRKMGGLWRKMPITYITFVIGALALCAVPPFAGFYSKETIIEAAKLSDLPGSSYAYVCVALGAMVTALYTFRALFMTFHGRPRMDEETWSHVHESPWVIYVPLILLAIPSMILGYVLYMPMLFNQPAWLASAITILPQHNVLAEISHEVISPANTLLHAADSFVFWLTLAGIFIAWVAYVLRPDLPGLIIGRMRLLYRVLMDKYGFDALYNWLCVLGLNKLGRFFYRDIDQAVIDRLLVNGTGHLIKRTALAGKWLQSGYIYHYIASMVFGVLGFLCWMLYR